MKNMFEIMGFSKNNYLCRNNTFLNMEQPIHQSYPQPTNKVTKNSDTISWIGFSLSLFVLLLWWLIFIAAVTIDSDGAGLSFSFFMFIGPPLGLVGFVLSLVGLIKASNMGGKKRIGVCGLFFSGLTILSVISVIFIGPVLKSHTIEVELPDTVESGSGKEVILYVDGTKLKCYDNRIRKDDKPYETRLKSSTQISRELEVWFKVHDIAMNEPIILIITDDSDYDKVADLIDALNIIGLKNFQLKTGPSYASD